MGRLRGVQENEWSDTYQVNENYCYDASEAKRACRIVLKSRWRWMGGYSSSFYMLDEVLSTCFYLYVCKREISWRVIMYMLLLTTQKFQYGSPVYVTLFPSPRLSCARFTSSAAFAHHHLSLPRLLHESTSTHTTTRVVASDLRCRAKGGSPWIPWAQVR